MPQEGERPIKSMVDQLEDLQYEVDNKNAAESALFSLSAALGDAETEKIVDLGKVATVTGDEVMSKREAITKSLGWLKSGLEYLNPTQRGIANGLIMRAEIYLSS